MKQVQILFKENPSFISEFNRLLEDHELPYLLILSEKDTVPKNYAKILRRVLDRNPALSFVTSKTFFQCPDRLTGTMLRKSLVKERLREEMGSLREAAVLLPLLTGGTGKRVKIKGFEQGDPGNGKYTENPDCFTLDWYFHDLREVLIPILDEAAKKYGKIPAIYQRYALFTLRSRLDANQNNRNRHAVPEEKLDELISLYAEVLSRIDDEEILNSRKAPVYTKSVSIRRMLLRLKYRTDYVPLVYRQMQWDNERRIYTEKPDGAQKGFNAKPDGAQKVYTEKTDSVRIGYMEKTDSTQRTYTKKTCDLRRVDRNIKEGQELVDDYTAFFQRENGTMLPVAAMHQVKANILLMDLEHGCLEIDGTLPDYFREEAGRYEFRTFRTERESCGSREGKRLCCLRKENSSGSREEKQIVNRVSLVWNEGYSLTKYFGRSAYKRFSFHASVPLTGGEEELGLFFIPAAEPAVGTAAETAVGTTVEPAAIQAPKPAQETVVEPSAKPGGGEVPESVIQERGIHRDVSTGMEKKAPAPEFEIPLTYPSHTSRLAAWPRHSYWHAKDRADRRRLRNELCGNNSSGEEITHPDYLLQNIYKDGGDAVQGIRIRPYKRLRAAREEAGLLSELLFSFSMHRFRFFLLRSAWLVTRPVYRKKRIWFYMDKIYKGGDSAEYLYRYAIRQKDGICHRYLIDPASPDAALLKKEGFPVLPRGSFRHRLDFLSAEKVFATNSTVFAFNDYYLENSRYIRGIPDFDVVCLQHGLSVQKIAVAQNRLRDNIRLYCCASPAEIENLSRPVYNYPDRRVLKLTGIPRYDGLKNEAEPMILISPTWRMQSAMPVTKNEGVERDYNPLFKDTPYFRIYNGLLHDPRLLEAARKHGCRIIYLMHPITSPQAGDFRVEAPVEIVPATADMRYEDYFRRGALMVTDYSGVQFDFAWMKKPVVYFQPPELEGHYEEGTFHYDTMAFGEIVEKEDALVDTLIRYMEEGFVMPQQYRERVEDFFAFHDHENTRRVYEAALKM